MTRPPTHPRRDARTRAGNNLRCAARRHGSIYLLVLGVCAIIMVIGMSAIAAVRIQHRSTQAREDATQAQHLADAALQIVFARLGADPDWRSTEAHDTWSTPQATGAGLFRYRLVDETDADLTNNDDDPVRVYTHAAVGDAARYVSILIDPHPELLGPELLANGDFETGTPPPWVPATPTDVTIDIDSTDPAEGNHALRVSNRNSKIYGPTQDLRGVVQDATTYRAQAWVKMKDNPEDARVGLAIETILMIPSYKVVTQTVGTDWTFVSGHVTSQYVDTNPAYLNFNVDTSTSAQRFWIDGASLREVLCPPGLFIVRGSYRRELAP